ncbi:MAG TPA: exodeoxyribonuclease VII small subunit [Hymenobacter sp.]|jgi:exodeoxyribonuclease VII small subunit
MPKTAPKTYREQAEALQEIIEKLEGGELDIDDAVECYGQGLKLIAQLEARLAKAENKITVLQATGKDQV